MDSACAGVALQCGLCGFELAGIDHGAQLVDEVVEGITVLGEHDELAARQGQADVLERDNPEASGVCQQHLLFRMQPNR